MSSTLTFHYASLSEAAKKAKRTANYLTDYKSDLSSKVAQKLSNLSGQDSAGYVGNAVNSASGKGSELDGISARFSDFSQKVDTLVSDARDADSRVASEIRDVGSACVGKRSWFEKAGDWLYNTFCVDLANASMLTKLFADTIGWVGTRFSNAREDVYNWFKYKGGKYVWNIVKSGAAIIAAGVSLMVAVGEIVLSGPILVVIVTIAGAVAAAVLLITTTINSVTSIGQNIKAMKEYEEGKLGQARYHGNVSSFSEYTKKTDFGGQEDNRRWENAGTAVDAVQTSAKIVRIGTNIMTLGAHYDAKTGKMDGLSIKNVKSNIMKSLGFKRKRYSIDSVTGKKIAYNGEKSGYKVGYQWSFKNMFSARTDGGNKSYLQKYLGFGSSDKAFYGTKKTTATLQHQFQKLTGGQKVLKVVVDTTGVIKTTMTHLENLDKVKRTMDGKIDFSIKTINTVIAETKIWKPINAFNDTIFNPIYEVYEMGQ